MLLVNLGYVTPGLREPADSQHADGLEGEYTVQTGILPS